MWWTQACSQFSGNAATGGKLTVSSEQIPFQGLDPHSILLKAKQLMK
jgi:hypothetical protein